MEGKSNPEEKCEKDDPEREEVSEESLRTGRGLRIGRAEDADQKWGLELKEKRPEDELVS